MPIRIGIITGSVSGFERSPERGMATHSHILDWEIPWTEEPGGLQSMEPQKIWTRIKTTATTVQGH